MGHAEDDIVTLVINPEDNFWMEITDSVVAVHGVPVEKLVKRKAILFEEDEVEALEAACEQAADEPFEESEGVISGRALSAWGKLRTFSGKGA